MSQLSFLPVCSQHSYIFLLMGRSFILVNFLFPQDIVKAHFLQTGGTVGNVVLSQIDTQSLSAGVCPSDVFKLEEINCPTVCSSFRRQSVSLVVFLAPLKGEGPADHPITPPPTTPGLCCTDSSCVYLLFAPWLTQAVCVGWRKNMERGLVCAPHFLSFLLPSPWTHLPMSSLKTDYCPFM